MINSECCEPKHNCQLMYDCHTMDPSGTNFYSIAKITQITHVFQLKSVE